MSAMVVSFTRYWRSLSFTLLVAASLAGSTAQAQEPAAPPASYEVEVIVFRHLDGRHTSEVAPPAMPAGIMSAGDAARAGSDRPAGTFPALTPQSLKLGGIATRLRRSAAYQVLWHGGWVQELTGQNRALATPLPPEAERAGAAGSVTLWRERFLHADVEIGLAGVNGGSPSAPDIGQSRRLRGSGVHYFDDPVVGVLLAVRPVGRAAPSAQQGE